MIVGICCAITSLLAVGANAETYTWQPTAGGFAYNWNSGVGWGTTDTFPSVPGDVASVTSNITGTLGINLQQNITIGTLNLGDFDGSNGFQILAGSPTTNMLSFETVSGPAQINLGATGLATNTIFADVQLNSNTIVTAGTQKLTFAGGLNVNGKTLTIAGGSAGLIDFGAATTGKLTGSGTIIKNNTSTVTIQNYSNTFTGTIKVNNGKLLAVSGGLATAQEINVAGYWVSTSSSASAFTGGLLEIGDLSAKAFPGQRLSSQTVSLDGGHLNFIGQSVTPSTTNPVQDNVANLTFNSGYSFITIGSSGTTGGSIINATNLNRNNRATAALRSAALGTTSKVLAGNVNAGSHLRGTVGGTGTSVAIIPWMVANNTSNSTANPSLFATYTAAGGLKALAGGEMDGTLAGTATRNVLVGSALLGAGGAQTVNSVTYTGGFGSNIGNGATLTVTGGGVLFQTGNGTNGAIGILGDMANAGTLAFGEGEGVVWSLQQATNAIGAIITGTGGLTKAGLGTLTLGGNNQYSGSTYVSAGTLRVGDGANVSDLGTGNATVAVGATLRISSAGAIDNTATLTLDQSAVFNGKLTIDAGLTEVVAGLYLGQQAQSDGLYGSTLAAAANPSFTVITNDTYFSGTGLLHVTAIPEPTATMSLAMILPLLYARRRRRSACPLFQRGRPALRSRRWTAGT